MDFTPLLRLYARYRSLQLACQDPVAVQRDQLIGLLQTAKNTTIGRQYNFSEIRSVEEYQSIMPIRTYDDFWNEYWKDAYPNLINLTWPGKIPYFCWSSGTSTGKRKFIPFSEAMHKSYNKAGVDLLVHHVCNRPQSKILGGKSFMMGGTTRLVEEAPGVYQCEVSGVSAKKLPAWARPFFFPPPELTDIPDWMERAEKIAQRSRNEDIRLIGGMPSWLLILLEKFPEYNEGTHGLLNRLFPNLEMFVHGGVKFDPYLKQYQNLLAGSHCELREIYPASEGFFGVADRGYGQGIRLLLDNQIFYEFVPVDELSSPNPTRHWIQNVEKDVNYAIVLTTCSGSWSYLIGDTVRFVDTEVPRILITGRTSYGLSAFGEHLIQEEIEKAVQVAADQIGYDVVDFSVGVHVIGQPGNLGNHVYVVEFAKLLEDQQLVTKFAAVLDSTLLALNDDYLDHRAPGCGVNAPEVLVMPPGGFAKWMASRGKLGDQHKVARVITDKQLFESLKSYVSRR